MTLDHHIGVRISVPQLQRRMQQIYQNQTVTLTKSSPCFMPVYPSKFATRAFEYVD